MRDQLARAVAEVDEVVPLLVRAFDRDPEKEGLADVVGFLARRYSWLKPYLKWPETAPATRSEPARTARQEPVYYGIHGGIKDFYKVVPEEEHAATLDHIVGAVGG